MTIDTPRWHPGEHHLLVFPGGAVVLSEAVSAENAEQIWHAMRRKASIAGFLEALVQIDGSSLLQLPSFAIALFDDDGCHLAVRGEFQILAGEEGLTGAGVTTWLEKRIARPERLTLLASDPVGPGRPIVDGLVSGGALSLGEGTGSITPQDSAAEVASTAAPTHVAQAPVEQEDGARGPEADDRGRGMAEERSPEGVSSQGIPAGPAQPVDRRFQETRQEEDPSSGAADDSASGASVAEDLGEPGEPSEDVVDSSRPVAPAFEVPVVESAPSKYASLFGDSIAVSAEDAAVRDDGDAEPASLVDPIVVPWGASAAAQEPPQDADQEPHQGADQEQETPDDVAHSLHVNYPDSDLHDGHTIVDFGELEAAAEAGSTPESAPGPAVGGGAPMVLASFCQRGHANPPQRSTCRVCDSPVESRTERTPRPALGRIRLSSGELVDLAGPVIAGRSPTARGYRGEQQPRLLALPHPHVSGNHIEFFLEDWTVMMRDLRSRNGSYLRRSGKPPVRLPETAMPLASGDIIDLGHGVFLYLEHLP